MYKLYSGRVAKLSGFRPFLQRDKCNKNPKDTWLQVRLHGFHYTDVQKIYGYSRRRNQKGPVQRVIGKGRNLRQTCTRRLGRRPPPPPTPLRPPPRMSPTPTPPAAEDAARCCRPADCSQRAMTASPESPAAADEAAAAAEVAPPPPPRWDRF